MRDRVPRSDEPTAAVAAADDFDVRHWDGPRDLTAHGHEGRYFAGWLATYLVLGVLLPDAASSIAEGAALFGSVFLFVGFYALGSGFARRLTVDPQRGEMIWHRPVVKWLALARDPPNGTTWELSEISGVEKRRGAFSDVVAFSVKGGPLVVRVPRGCGDALVASLRAIQPGGAVD